ncbi:MAG: sigma-70 family RNA polymerase sigma factor [Nocardioidaceae bacterium]|nr:sigma-70 family RNA polymerase sigma factor [Nocardioidaceae bacterium]
MGLSDETLLAGMADGDRDAASAFVRRYQARVFGLALTIVRSPEVAEEVAQEVFLKAWRHAGTYDARRGRVATWLLSIAHNAAVDAVRYRHEDPVDPELLAAVLAPDRATHGFAEDDTATRVTLRDALAALPVEQRAPIVLMTFQGLTAQEIADRDGVPLGTVKSRVRRGLRRLRDGMGARHD